MKKPEAGGVVGSRRRRESDMERATIQEGKVKPKFRSLGWQKLTICLIVEAIALGALSIPSAFAALGMVAGTYTDSGTRI